MKAGLPRVGRKDVRQEIEVLLSLGFQFDGLSASGHLRFSHPDHGPLSPLSATPRSPHWRRSHRGRVAAVLGITGGELNERLGHGNSSRGGRRRKGVKAKAHKLPSSLRLAPKPEKDEKPVPHAINRTDVRWRRQRCNDCGHPWTAECAHVQACPRCESENTVEERRAA